MTWLDPFYNKVIEARRGWVMCPHHSWPQWYISLVSLWQHLASLNSCHHEAVGPQGEVERRAYGLTPHLCTSHGCTFRFWRHRSWILFARDMWKCSGVMDMMGFLLLWFHSRCISQYLSNCALKCVQFITCQLFLNKIFHSIYFSVLFFWKHFF